MKDGSMNRLQAQEYASWFRCLADATRLQLLHALAAASAPMTIGELVEAVDVGQSTVSGHVRRLADAEFVFVERAGTTTTVRVNPDCLTALPEAAAVIMRRREPVAGSAGRRGPQSARA